MQIAVGCDHAGFPLKAHVVEQIRAAGHEIIDCGAKELVPGDDYPDYALAVAEAVRSGRAERGVVVCGSGVGVSVAANKIPGIRASMCHDTFLGAKFSGAERHQRRLNKVKQIEADALRGQFK
jgi:ribose 5-phosphate isomerase B